MDSQVLFSIIIPHKNIPTLLQRCLNSIPHRDDVQIIVVDDNSDADNVDFEHFPGLGEPNIEVYFTKEGKGAGYARNIGLRHAIGKWILFADADDYYNTTNLSLLLENVLDVPFQVVFFFCEYISLKKTRSIETYNCNLNSDEIVPYFDTNYIMYRYTMAPWRKIIRRKHIFDNKLTFEEVIASNDCRFAMDLANVTQSVGIFPKVIYYYEQRSNSLVRTINRHYLICKMNVGIRMNRQLKKKGVIQYKDATHVYLYEIGKISWCLFLYFALKEMILVDIKTAMFDIKYAIYHWIHKD